MSEKATLKDKKSAPVGEKEEGEKKPVSKLKSGVIFNGLIILSLLVMTGYFWMDADKAMRVQDEINQVDAEKIVRLEGFVDDLNAADVERSSVLKKELIKLQQQQLKYQSLIEDVAAVISNNRVAISLQEAKYLIFIAHKRLRFAQDVEGALAALIQAELILSQEKNKALLALREVLAADILSLKSVPLVNTESIAIKLITIESRVATLPLNKAIKATNFTEKNGKLNLQGLDVTDWELALEKIWREFSKLLVIQRSDEVLAPVLLMEDEPLVRNNLLLKLEMVRLALLNKQQRVYQASITTAIQWLDLYFYTSDARVAAIKQELEQLNGLVINPDLPDLSKTLKFLHDQNPVIEGAQ